MSIEKIRGHEFMNVLQSAMQKRDMQLHDEIEKIANGKAVEPGLIERLAGDYRAMDELWMVWLEETPSHLHPRATRQEASQ